MSIALWIASGILAIVFITTGVIKLIRPESNGFGGSRRVVRTIGVLEIAGGLGVILPAATGILPILTLLAALGLALTMVVAFLTHVSRRHLVQGIPPVVLLTLALFVALGRPGS